MNAEVPVQKIFINIFIQLSFLFFTLFGVFVILSFMREEVKTTRIISVLIACLVSYFLIAWVCFLTILSRYNEVKTKLIELGFTITEIKNRKFKIVRDKEKYTLEVFESKHLYLILTSEDETSTTIHSMNELVILLYRTNKSQILSE